MYVSYNANPTTARVGDCTVRAISKATGQSWEKTYIDISLQGLRMHDMPSANHVWGSYLDEKGYTRHIIPFNTTVAEFAANNAQGSYILAISGHVVAVVDGDYYDTWDSGDEIPIYYWKKEKQ